MMPSDTYRYLKNNRLVCDYQSLSQCYLPIIGQDAASLYTYLLSSFDDGAKAHSLTELLNHLQFGMNRLIAALDALMGMGLLALYQEDNHYLVKLEPVLSTEQFLSKELYKVLLERRIGQPSVAELTTKVPEDVANITKSFAQVFSSEGELVQSLDKPDMVRSFNLNHFKQLMTRDGLGFLDEATDTIALYHLADRHKLNWHETYLLAKKTAINLTISVKRMEEAVTTQEAPVQEAGDLTAQEEIILREAKASSAELFLAKIKKTRKAVVTADEQKLLVTLAEVGFLDEVINVMVLYTFNKTQSANLQKSYLQKMANDFAYQGIKTAREAIIKLRDQGKTKQHQDKQAVAKTKKTNVPTWSNPDYKNQTTDQERQDLAQLKADLLAQMRKAGD